MENSPPRRPIPNLRPSPPPPPPSSAMPILLLSLSILLISSQNAIVSAARVTAPAKSDSFTPPDNFLLDCGATNSTTLGGRVFLGDQETSNYLSYNGRDIQVSTVETDFKVPSPIYLSAIVFESEATYTFHVTRPGWHWIRLHFAPVPNNESDLKHARFKVRTSNNLVLIHEFESEPNATWTLREFLVNVTTERYSLTFEPAQGSTAFVNAIEFVSAPDILIGDVASAVSPPKSDYSGLLNVAYQTVYRLNVGGPAITSQNDTLGRMWDADKAYLDPKVTGSDVSVQPNVITYPEGESPLIAPPTVYATATQMADANVQAPNFNVTWQMKIDNSFQYLVRLHFADIVSKSENDLYFNVYINGEPGITGLDLTTVAGGLSAAYFADFVVNSSMVSSLDPLTVQIGPMKEDAGTKNALLNGIEVLKMNNSVGSLDGEFGVTGARAEEGNAAKGTVAAVGFAMMFGAFVGLGAIAVKWRKRPQDWQKSKSFSSWLLPLHAGDTSFMSNSKTSLGSRKSQFFSSTNGLGRYFSLDELQEATKNWDPKEIIGVGGFGNVYLGVIDDGVKVAVKRGNPQSEQGINEFQTEIQMLSKLRHRHLVSLIGYCDENSEMILVYEFMSNGPFRDHLYGKDLPTMSWKQRLEVCIGACRGLHYLHTGTAQGIIHRDVKTTNILLDENFNAKVADFGLSKDGAPSGSEQTHVSTAVKGSFGYLDPEYFRKQQLTDKSDVYSFGVVLLEALCARPAINPALPREQVNLAEWAMQWKRKGLLEKIMDPKLVGHINPESMKKFAEAAEKCLAEYGVDRPPMGDVLWNLEASLQLQDASVQGKADEENKAFANSNAPFPSVSPAVDAGLVPENKAGGHDEAAGANAAQVAAVDEHSGTAMFAQFAALNGR